MKRSTKLRTRVQGPSQPGPAGPGRSALSPHKSVSGVRWVSIPPFLLPDVIEHLEQFTGPAGDALVFTGPKGAQLRRGNFTRQWRKALEAAGITGIHLHDLRHTGNTLAEVRPGPACANSWTG